MQNENPRNKSLKSYANKSISNSEQGKVFFKKKTIVAGKTYGPDDGWVSFPKRTVDGMKTTPFAAKGELLFDK